MTAVKSKRRSSLTKSDCLYIARLMNNAQQQLMEYVANGCPETGLHDDFQAWMTLIPLHDKVGEFREYRKQRDAK